MKPENSELHMAVLVIVPSVYVSSQDREEMLNIANYNCTTYDKYDHTQD